MVRKFSQDRIKEELLLARAPRRKEDPRMREGREKRRREEKQKNRFGESGGPFLCT